MTRIFLVVTVVILASWLEAGSVVKLTGGQGSWQLTVDGSPSYLTGLCWGPDISKSTVAKYTTDVQSTCAKAVRTWGTGAGTQTPRDAAARRGIKVVMGVWRQRHVEYADDQPYQERAVSEIRRWVKTYKDHPGVLMWDVGNVVLL